jgi:AcrR family transcriptional regulator
VRRLTRQESHQETRRLLLESASVVFTERGFHGATVEAIVHRSGFSRGAFYSNFADLNEIFLALLEERMDREATAIGVILLEASSGAHLVELLHQRRITAPDDPNWRLLLAEFRLQALRDPQLKPRLAAREQKLRSMYRVAVEHVAATLGGGETLDVGLTALMVQVLEDGFAFHRMLEPDQVPSGTFIKALLLLIDALSARAERDAKRDPA